MISILTFTKEFYWFIRRVLLLLGVDRKGHNIKLSRLRFRKLDVKILGGNSDITISGCCYLENVLIEVKGNGNSLFIGDNVVIRNSIIRLQDFESKMVIGKGSTIMGATLQVVEDGRMLTIGEDCMFSSGIEIRTSDGHSIFDSDGYRANPAKDVWVGKHVWLNKGVCVMKGTKIGDGSVIGFNSIVTKNIPANVVAAGSPCKVIKENMHWKRERNISSLDISQDGI